MATTRLFLNKKVPLQENLHSTNKPCPHNHNTNLYTCPGGNYTIEQALEEKNALGSNGGPLDATNPSQSPEICGKDTTFQQDTVKFSVYSEYQGIFGMYIYTHTSSYVIDIARDMRQGRKMQSSLMSDTVNVSGTA